MISILQLVGSKAGRLIAGALVVILILFSTIRYIQLEERDKVTNEIQIETLQNGVEARERADQNVKEIRRNNPDNSGSVALEQLRSRQSGR